MSNDPTPGGEQPGWHGQPPYPGAHPQPGDQPAYPSPSYPTAGQPGGYGQGPWVPQAGQGPGWPGGSAPAGAGPGGLSPQDDTPSFTGALFDFGFNRFATPVVIKVLYILSLVGIGLTYVVGVISGFAQDPVSGLVAVVVGAVLALLALIYTRVILELLFAVVRLAEDVRAMRNRS
jgi:hypothetical protein